MATTNSSPTDATSKTQAEVAVEWLEKFLPTAIEIAIFGGSITFTVVIGETNKPAHIFGAGTVNTFLALAWLFFVLALGLASIAHMALSVNRVLVLEGFRKGRYGTLKAEKNRKAHKTTEEQEKQWKTSREMWTHGWWRRKFSGEWWAAKMDIFVLRMFVKFPLSLTVQIFILAAFVFLSLVVVAYSKEVGLIAVGFTGLCTFGALVAWSVQVLTARKEHGEGEGEGEGEEIRDSRVGCC